MRHYIRAVVLMLFVALASLAFAAAPERSKGISVHMLPKRVADLGATKWGFVVSYAPSLQVEKEQPVLQSTSEVLAFVRKQEKSVQENGIWIVTTHPDAYSESEKKLLEDIKVLCRREAIPLFIVRGSQLPNGWQRYDDAKGAVELGWSYFNKGDMDTALKRFNQALILDPDFAPAYFGIAYVYSVQNKFDLAIQNYRKSIEKDPTFSHSYSNLGLALLYSGKQTEALPQFKKALDIDPKNGDAHVNIALYYFAVGDYPSSWKHIHLAQDNKTDVNPNFLHDLRAKLPEPPRG